MAALSYSSAPAKCRRIVISTGWSVKSWPLLKEEMSLIMHKVRCMVDPFVTSITVPYWLAAFIMWRFSFTIRICSVACLKTETIFSTSRGRRHSKQSTEMSKTDCAWRQPSFAALFLASGWLSNWCSRHSILVC